MTKHLPNDETRYAPDTVVFDGTETKGEAITAVNNARRRASDRYVADHEHMRTIRPLTFPALSWFPQRANTRWRYRPTPSVKPGDGVAKHETAVAVGRAACTAAGVEFWALAPYAHSSWGVTPDQRYVQVTVRRDTRHDSATITVREWLPEAETIGTYEVGLFSLLVDAYSETVPDAQLSLVS